MQVQLDMKATAVELSISRVALYACLRADNSVLRCFATREEALEYGKGRDANGGDCTVSQVFIESTTTMHLTSKDIVEWDYAAAEYIAACRRLSAKDAHVLGLLPGINGGTPWWQEETPAVEVE